MKVKELYEAAKKLMDAGHGELDIIYTEGSSGVMGDGVSFYGNTDTFSESHDEYGILEGIIEVGTEFAPIYIGN